MSRSPALFAVMVLALAACGKQQAATVQTPATSHAADRQATAPAPATTPAATSNVGVSGDLARACALKLEQVESAPKFDYDASELQSDDRAVLEQIAECLTRGPLKGRSVKLIGRADPRGTDEYNLGLGSRRAASVSAYLRRLGVAPTQLSQTTRGSLDAAGHDETSWQRDRRVDLDLVN